MAQPERPLRVGVLGTSYWAWWCHGAALAAAPGAELVGFWGRTPANARAAAERVGGQAFEDLDQLLEQVDAVSIALPPDVQAPVAVRAADAGKHLLLDKPLALEVAAADEVVRAVDAAGVSAVSFMTFLFQPGVVAWLEDLNRIAEENGPWEVVQISLAGSISAPGSPYAESVWRHEHGGLWDWGPHALSLVRSLLPPVERVSATRGPRDIVNVALEHTGGASSLLTLTVSAPEAATHTTATVWGPGGRHHIELPLVNQIDAYAGAFGQLLESIASDRPHPLDAAYGRQTVAILDAARRNLAIPSESRMASPEA